ncbi:PREDICTED: F-box protein PP2-B11-like [Ipomoea nil]|uniref:F-box protein PP2-B11-like n=1 Tax=Ipomoea nil TaxID=35883 RepID=UPI000901B945|nr:PREDICTED: F-box protein PP2-B11-like [Ipomoea nil]XP_019198422.1 PREDICTED: F-box protein PP2-B11-like [Ipomoea nil]
MEDILTRVLCLTDPRFVCSITITSQMFNRAAGYDLVWNTFLPPNFRQLIEGLPNADHLLTLPRKTLFLYLTENPVCINDRNVAQKILLNRNTGHIAYFYAGTSINVSWFDEVIMDGTHQRESSISTPIRPLWFPRCMDLINPLWLQLNALINPVLLSRNCNYTVRFIFRMLPEFMGQNDAPDQVLCNIRIGGRPVSARLVYFRSNNAVGPGVNEQLPHDDDYWASYVEELEPHGWLEANIGEFYLDNDDRGNVHISIRDMTAANWKGFIQVAGIECIPSD